MRNRCPRDEGGFCRIALAGHRLCPDRRGDCSVVDPAVAWEEVRTAAIAALARKNRRLAREARRA